MCFQGGEGGNFVGGPGHKVGEVYYLTRGQSDTMASGEAMS